MSKVQSGTFGVIYEVLGADPTHMKLAPILERLQHAPALKITDLQCGRRNRYADRSYSGHPIPVGVSRDERERGGKRTKERISSKNK